MKEKILKLLDNEYSALDYMEINERLGLTTSEEYKEVIEALDELEKEYEVYRTKKDKFILIKNCNNIEIGKLEMNSKGFGFLNLDQQDDIYISADNMNGAIHGDTIIVETFAGSVKKEGRVLNIIKRDLDNIVGEIIYKDHKIYIKPDEKKKNLEIIIDKESAKNCVEGNIVCAKIDTKIGRSKYKAHVTRIVGHKNDPRVDILTIAYKHGIENEFSDSVKEEVNKIPTEVSDVELNNKKRIDLRDKLIYTIDGDDTKDIDDAVSLTKENGVYHFGVHIADVSYYVKENTAIGDDAYLRGTSNYLADTVIPMLPHKLSNGICSLNPNEDRLSISVTADFDENGALIPNTVDIKPSIIKSAKQMTYKKVNDILMRGIVAEDYKPYKDNLLLMNELALKFRKRLVDRGYIQFDESEVKIVQDEHGKAIDVIKREREDGEKLIEVFMITANELIATFMNNLGLPFIYRVHETPKEEKIEDFVNMVKLLGYQLSGKVKDLNPKSMQNLLDQLADKKEYPLLSDLLLRSMKKAFYSPNNVGHFGLASRCYTHFTSPIRRFPDLQVHRLIRKFLFEGDYTKESIERIELELAVITEHCSEREVAAQEAEREVDDMKMAEYMSDHIGEVYDAKISGVTSFGFFVKLNNLIEGLVHVNTLKGDYYTYVPETVCLIGRSTKKTYRLGDELKVKLIAANKETTNIDFEVVDEKTLEDNQTENPYVLKKENRIHGSKK